jgi:molybdopterin synthase catalytic subunit
MAMRSALSRPCKVVNSEWVQITSDPIPQQALPRDLSSDGAVIEFYGVVRNTEDTAEISALDYEAFVEMAEHQLAILRSTIITEERISQLECIHRVGVVAVGEASLFVRVVAPHRAEAFAAMTRFIDELKKIVPIWKHSIKSSE